MLESPTGTQANKHVLYETTDKFSNLQEVVTFASLMLPILNNLGLSEFEAKLPTRHTYFHDCLISSECPISIPLRSIFPSFARNVP